MEIPPHQVKDKIWALIQKESNKKEINPIELTPEKICDKLNASNVDIPKVESVLENFVNDDEYSMVQKSIKLNVFIPQDKENNIPNDYERFFVYENKGKYFFGLLIGLLLLQYPPFFNSLFDLYKEVPNAVGYVVFGVFYGFVAAVVLGELLEYFWRKLSEKFTLLKQYKDLIISIIVLMIVVFAVLMISSEFDFSQVTNMEWLTAISISVLGGLGIFHAISSIRDKKRRF